MLQTTKSIKLYLQITEHINKLLYDRIFLSMGHIVVSEVYVNDG